MDKNPVLLIQTIKELQKNVKQYYSFHYIFVLNQKFSILIKSMFTIDSFILYFVYWLYTDS